MAGVFSQGYHLRIDVAKFLARFAYDAFAANGHLMAIFSLGGLSHSSLLLWHTFYHAGALPNYLLRW